MAVITGRGRMGTVAHAVMRRVAVAGARTTPIPVAGVGAPGMVPVRVVAVDHRAFDVGGAVIAMIGGIGVAAAAIAWKQPAAGHRGRSAHGHHGDGRRHSLNRLTHYSLLWIRFLLALVLE